MIRLRTSVPCVRHFPAGSTPLLLALLVLLCIIYVFNVLPSRTLSANSDSLEDERQPNFQAPANFANVRVHKPQEIIEDEHVRKTENLKETKRLPQRVAMGPCPPVYGKVTVFVAMIKSSYERFYHVAQDSLKCYLKSVNYTLLLVDLDSDERVNKECGHTQLFFKKHCAAAAYLRDTDWMLVLDADTGVVNPNHCIEEWIDPRADLVFYERFFNWEIASGNYLVKNTPWATKFLKKWADWQYEQPSNWNGADNGVLQIHVLQSVMPEARNEIKICDQVWHKGTGYDTYMAYVTCCKLALGATRLWPGKVRLLRRAHGWVRDGYLSGDKWCQRDFMLHGWKLNQTEIQGWQSPYKQMFKVEECGSGESGWHWREDYRVSEDEIRKSLANFEKGAGANFPKEARIHPYLSEGDIGDCWPHCDDFV
uniref:Uncharacterized protein n=1 Tax=Plectus sambesii TaxID=2011161 RepID=A0A914VAW0_9BILA